MNKILARRERTVSRRRKRHPKVAPVAREAREMIGNKIVYFTNHAIERFIQRSVALNPPPDLKNPEESAWDLLIEAKEDLSLDKVAKVKRMINNRFEDEINLAYSGLRFVLKPKGERILIVVTVEPVKRR